MEKIVYEAPALTEVGSLEEITKATSGGVHYDANAKVGGLPVPDDLS